MYVSVYIYTYTQVKGLKTLDLLLRLIWHLGCVDERCKSSTRWPHHSGLTNLSMRNVIIGRSPYIYIYMYICLHIGLDYTLKIKSIKFDFNAFYTTCSPMFPYYNLGVILPLES